MNAFAKLGIDAWGILLYLVNFGVLFLVLNKFVYKPLLGFLDKRRSVIAESVSEAEALRKEFAEANAAHARETAEAMRKLAEDTGEALGRAKEEARLIIEEAGRQREQLLAKTQGDIERMKADLIRGVEEELRERMKQALLLILRDGIPEEVARKSIEQAWAEVKAARV